MTHQRPIHGSPCGRHVPEGAKRKSGVARYHRLFLTTAIVAFACAADGLWPARAQSVSGSGDISTLPVVSPVWNIGHDIAIGDFAYGELFILNGGQVTSTSSAIAYNSGSTGLVTISGIGSSWINDTISIGKFGDGTLNVEDGGLLSTGDLWVGEGGPTPGSSTLNITNGGIVTNTAAVIGSDGATGHVVLSDYGSAWSNSAGLFIGTGGAGTILIEDGGVLRSAYGALGTIGGGFGPGDGTVTVNGSDGSGHVSTWINSGTLQLGNDNGSSGTLNIEDGGLVTTDSAAIGQTFGGAGAVTVTGNDGDGNRSTWSIAGGLTVGLGGSGTLTVGDGGLVTSNFANIGNDNGSTGTAIVSGTDSDGNASTWNVSGTLVVGYDGNATLTIDDGGIVRADEVGVGLNGTANGTINLDGDASGRGVLETGIVYNTGGGAASLNLDGGILRATRDQTGFLTGFAALTVGAKGAWFDTNGYDISVDSDFSGSSSFNKLGLGTLTLTGDSSGFTGTTEIQAGTLQLQGAILGGPANVLSGARLSGIGQVGDTDNRGTVAPGTSFGLGTLTVAGNYASTSGALEIKTQLGDDSSPTDLLAVTGATSGVTSVTVTNFGGLGAQTHNGILIVQVSGASAGQFVLNGHFLVAGQPAVVGGAYGYVLTQNPLDGGWYLHSTLLAGPDPDAPIYQPGVPVYEAYARTLLSLSELTSLRQRVGNREWAPSAGPKGEGAWLRTEGRRDHLVPKISTSGSQLGIDRWKTQFGADRILKRAPDGERLVAGVNAEIATATTDVSSLYGNGGIDTRSYGVGGSLTWYDSDGAYVDAQAKANWFASDLASAQTGNLAGNVNAYSYGLSLESGRSLQMGGGLAVTPQAQVSYVGTDFFAFDDAFEAHVASDQDESLQGRLGLSLDQLISWEDEEGRTSKATVYGLIDVRQEFLDGVSVAVSGTDIDNRVERAWGGIVAGGDYSWNDGQYALYGQVRADTGLDTFGESYSTSGTAGFRMAL